MIWQPEFTDKTLSRKPGAVHSACAVTTGSRPGMELYGLPGASAS
ncbi:hypothetical protein WDJ95_26685 [Escherichia coli]